MLQKIIFILFLFAGTLPRAQGRADTLKMISQKWKFSVAQSAGFDMGDKDDKEDFNKLIKTSWFLFKKDGILLCGDDEESVTGKWTYNSIKKELSMMIDDDVNVIKILSISSSRLKFESSDSEGLF